VRPQGPSEAHSRLLAFLEAWNSHDLDRIVATFAPGAVIEDELVVIDPDRPAGRRTYRGREPIRAFAALATPGFHAELVHSSERGQSVRFVVRVSADGLRRRGVEAIEQHDELRFDGDAVGLFRIRYPPSSRARLRAAADRAADRDAGPASGG
jgi:hypothetical protein